MNLKASLTGRAAAVTAALIFGAGCSGGPGSAGSPFGGTRAAPPGDHIAGDVVIGGIYDIEMLGMHNYSASPVRVTSVRLVSPGNPAVRVLSIRAYSLDQVGPTPDIDEGDLPKTCPQSYSPHPVTDVGVAPRKDSKWIIVIALKFTKPGRYDFGKVRIGFAEPGRTGSQSYYLENMFFRAVPARTHPHLYNTSNC